MRHSGLIAMGVMGLLALAGCGDQGKKENPRLEAVNVIDESNLNDVMLSVADPDEAVAYFQRTLRQKPDRIDVRRGLAQSLIRAKRNTEAASAWKNVVDHPEATNADRVEYADALIRNSRWKDAQAELNKVPPTFETFKRYRLEAMVADSNKQWKKADSFYEIAVGLTTRPGPVMNNWGYSKMARGDFTAAESLFSDAIRQDSTLFTSKNNLVMARGAQKKYSLPVIPVTQTERAHLLYTLALSAIKQGDTGIGKTLLQDAVDTHPQHFEEAVRSLETLEGNVNG